MWVEYPNSLRYSGNSFSSKDTPYGSLGLITPSKIPTKEDDNQSIKF